MGIPGALRPRSNTEILDAAFALARRVGPQLLPISLLLGLPISIFALRFSRMATAGASPLGRGALAFLGLVVIAPILESLRTWVLEAALIEAIASGQVSWPAVRRRFFSVFWRLVGSQIALVWLGALCSIALVVPGVIFTLHRIFYSEVLLAEGKAVRSSFRRSFALTDGGLGRLGMLVLGGTLLLAALNWGFSLWAGKNLVGAALGWFGSGCIALVKASFYLLAYYDLRARREGLDLLVRDSEFGGARRRHAEPDLTQGDPSQVLHGILAEPEFDTDWQEHVARWLGQAWRSFQHWLRDLPDFERWALLVACVGILAWLVWTMVASYREMMAPDASALKGAGADAPPEPTWQALMAHARVLASEGRLREGARALQQAVYSVLASRKRLAWDGSRADWEWVARLGAGPELGAFTEEAQAIAYGSVAADAGLPRFEALLATADRWIRP